jgi:carbamoyl-phosphate synthase large subunit
MKLYNILVTGCGGDVSQSIGKALQDFNRKGRLIGCDIHADHAGHFIFDECFVVERASSKNYYSSLTDLIEKNAIDILIPATEYELEVFLSHKINLGCLIIRPNDKSIALGLDKLETATFLERHGLPFPKTCLLSEVTSPKFPAVVKARTGSGSKSLHVVEEMETFLYLKKTCPSSVYQEFLSSSNEEFTCGLFRSGAGEIRMIIFRRRLTSGFSTFGIVEENDQIQRLLNKIATLLDLRGSINVQLRLKDEVPIVFEINARFSSTVMFRHMLGFRDVIWSIQDQLGFEIEPYDTVPAGSKFYKGYQEYICKNTN